MSVEDAVIVAHRPAARVSIDDVFPEEEILDWVTANYWPEEVFLDADLIEWAEDNGFTREEE